MKSKKMLAILGSPKKDGNVARMLNIVVQSAQESSFIVDTIGLYEKNISWCTGCMSCKKSGICIIDDDIREIRNLLIACDIVVLASPTYFANVPAIVKNMFDRLLGAVMDDNASSIPKAKLSNDQQYLLLSTCNTPFPFNYLAAQSKGVAKAMTEFFHISGMRKMGHIVFAGTRGKTEIPKSIQRKLKRYWK